MANLSGLVIKDNRKGILNLGNTNNIPLSTTLQYITDGIGTNSPLLLATNKVEIESATQYSWQNLVQVGLASKTTFYFDATGRMSWRNGTGYLRTFDAMGITADRVYTLPDATTTLAGLAVVNTFTERQLITAPSLTGAMATSVLSLTQTLNTTGSPDIINLDITNTASGASTNLLNLKVGGISLFRVAKTGGITVAGASTFNSSTTHNLLLDTNSNLNFRIVIPSATKTLLVNHDYSNTASASAIMELQSTTQGLLVPQMTTAQINAIASPKIGLLVFNITLDTHCQYTVAHGWARMVHIAM